MIMTYYMFLQKSQEVLIVNWAFDDVIHDDTIKRDGRDNGESGSMYKAPLDMTTDTFR